MSKLFALLIAATASLGLAFASTAALAQKAEPSKDAKKTEAPGEAKKAEAKKPEPKKPGAKKSEPMDINSATEKELATLPGIGEARATAIVKNRPYKGKDDLVQRRIISESVYKGISDRIIAKQK
jgi:competence protein ComEA